MIYRKDYIPSKTACNRRPALAMTATTITIHNTGNPSSTAANERSWLTNDTNNRQASFHIVVDSKEAIECIPLTENAWHAGDGSKVGSGNRSSIGVEICESGDYAKTLDNAATLVASMLKERGWGVDRLRRHFDWSGKICPHLMYGSGKWTGWTAFKNMVDYKLKTGGVAVNKGVKVTVNVNGKKVADGVLDNGTTYTPARAVAEALGATVVYDAETKTVNITK
ncbi:N-acetylmuramoyl-L-alanine amidase [Paenibacillus pseudetheri]|uniref:N-acetylmuramoyl-L-alanine amidase n=1 Tax=Paenibacillus pseudetheri TaxID=2897682 RepID=A0ABN8FQW9_9BACL|nr:N-acetylmuramoyl-L-alanine amidase [Paenibacillus pseudetheri]CAH1058837.1 hypothetical protein PAECIP111894_05023 [Paenibacillus pseudetheri]